MIFKDWAEISEEDVSLFVKRDTICPKCNSVIVYCKKLVCNSIVFKGACSNRKCFFNTGACQTVKNQSRRSNSTLAHWAIKVKKRDNFICQMCGSSVNVEAHHINPVQNNPKLKYEISNGICLCHKCHIDIHNKLRNKTITEEKMKPIANYEKVQAMSEKRSLPKGGYVAKILNAEVKDFTGKNGDYQKLEVSFDISEGEYKGFYAEDYRSQTSEDKKWKGILRLSVPTGDGSDFDSKMAGMFKGNIQAVEDSNAGYHWDWNEANLKNKIVGVIFQNREWEFNGKSGWKAQPHFFTSAENIRTGKFKVPNDKPLANKSKYPPVPTDNSMSDFEPISDSDLPW